MTILLQGREGASGMRDGNGLYVRTVEEGCCRALLSGRPTSLHAPTASEGNGARNVALPLHQKRRDLLMTGMWRFMDNNKSSAMGCPSHFWCPPTFGGRFWLVVPHTTGATRPEEFAGSEGRFPPPPHCWWGWAVLMYNSFITRIVARRVVHG